MHGEELSEADKARLYHLFELNYTPISTESDGIRGLRSGRSTFGLLVGSQPARDGDWPDANSDPVAYS